MDLRSPHQNVTSPAGMERFSSNADLETNLHHIILEADKVLSQSSVELAKKMTKTQRSMAAAKSKIAAEQAALQEELDIISAFWVSSLQRQTDRFMSDLSTKWTAIKRIETKMQTLKMNLEEAAKAGHVQSLVTLDRLFDQSRQECQGKKDKCRETHTRVQSLKKALRNVKQQTNRDNILLQEKEKVNDQLYCEVTQLDLDLENAEAELEIVTSSMLDESFGQNFKEIEIIVKEFNWDFSKLEVLLRNRGEFQRRIDRVEADKTGRERARQHKEMAKKHAELKKENERLHALQFRLKKEVISAERDLELAAGIRRFYYEPMCE